MVNHRPHKKQKIRPPLQQPRYGPNDVPDPSLGGNGYPESTRRIADELYNDVGRVYYLQLRNTTIPNLPHPVTVERYQQHINTTGSNIHMRHTGNRRSDGICGFPLLLLTFYRRAYPKASRYEIIAFLWRSYSSILPTPRIYSLNDITNAENAMGLIRKKGSTTAHQTFHPRNIAKRLQYWTTRYPTGINDIARVDMIDLDAGGLKLETANCRYGKYALSRRVRERGNYGHGLNHTLILAISGGPNGRRWRNFGTAGTNIITFDEFIISILDSLPNGTPGN